MEDVIVLLLIWRVGDGVREGCGTVEAVQARLSVVISHGGSGRS